VVAPELWRTRPVSAQLLAFRGPVLIGAEAGPRAAVRGMNINEGVTVATGPDAYAQIELPDGSRVAVPSQSRVRIDRLRLTLMTGAVQRVFTVETGRSESKVTPMKAPADSYIVRTPTSVSAVRGTEFRVRYDPDRHMAATEVIKGIVQVGATQGPPVAVAAGFGTRADETGVGGPEALLAEPSLLQPDRPVDEASAQVEITPVPGALAYRALLATDAGFVNTLAEVTSPNSTLALGSLPDGVYFVRLSVIAADGLEGRPVTYAVDRVLNTLSLAPSTAVGTGRDRRYDFRWDVEGDGRRTYRFQLFRDKNPQPVIDEPGLSDRQLTVTNLRPGLYSWRVMSRTVSPGRQVEKWSTQQSFHVGV